MIVGSGYLMTTRTPDMDNTEFQAEAERILAERCRRRPVEPPHRTGTDYAAAVADYFHMANGRHCENPEPLALEWRRDGANVGRVRELTGLSSSDFGGILESGLTGVLNQSFDDGTAGIRAVARDYQVENFRPINFVEFGLGAPVELPEGLPAPKLPSGITETASDGEPIKSYGGKISFSYPIWSTYGAEITSALENHAENFTGLEYSLIASLLAAASPPAVSGSLDAAGLTAASGALRVQLNSSNQKTNWPLKTVLVSPSDEGTARALAYSHGGWPQVAVNPELEGGSYYGFVAPSHSPLLRVRLRNAGRPRLYAKPTAKYEAAQFAISHDIGFVLLAGPGLVRVSP